MRTTGFTKRGVEWYIDKMAHWLRDGSPMPECFRKAEQLDGIHANTLRRRIKVDQIKNRAKEIGQKQQIILQSHNKRVSA
jgi:hypothetical protein